MSTILYHFGMHATNNSFLVYNCIMNIFYKRLKELREENKLLQKQLSKELGVSQVTIARWENGAREPSINMLIKIANFFSVSIDYLVGYGN